MVLRARSNNRGVDVERVDNLAALAAQRAALGD
jgi:hypothetical protein